MSPGDFWNLAGRAGRLRHTFGGYVWCIERDGWAEAAPLNAAVTTCAISLPVDVG